ncbi:hypothetical protein Tco_1103859 [Tanacetum coccineum]
MNTTQMEYLYAGALSCSTILLTLLKNCSMRMHMDVLLSTVPNSEDEELRPPGRKDNAVPQDSSIQGMMSAGENKDNEKGKLLCSAQRIAEERRVTETEEKKKAQVQFEAQHYTNEDLGLIKAKLESQCRVIKGMLEEQKLKGTSHDPITAKDLHDELLKESRVMEVKSAEEVEF